MLYRPKPKTSPLVDLSPLIDVVFLLLIFFMVSTTFKDDHGLDLDLPEATSVTDAKKENLTVYIGKDGQIKVGDAAVEVEELSGEIEKQLPNHQSRMVVFKVDQDVSHGLVVKVMDAAKAAGAEGLTLSAMGKN